MKRTRIRRQSKKRLARAAAYAAFRLGILARDRWQCRRCARITGPLDLHHVTKRSHDPRKLMDPENVVTLCRPCHGQTDDPYAWGRLVVRALAHGVFAFEVVYAPSKFAARESS